MEPEDLRVTNGAVKKVNLLEQGSNVGWRITVKPDGSGDVTVVLPIPTDCDDAGPRLCTEDNRAVANTPAGASQSCGRNHISDGQRGVTTADQSAIVSL